MKDYETKSCQGDCPKCGSDNLIWLGSENTGDALGHDFRCEDCGCEGTEWYNLTYALTEYR